MLSMPKALIKPILNCISHHFDTVFEFAAELSSLLFFTYTLRLMWLVLIGLIGVSTALLPKTAFALSITMITPGTSSEPFWVDATRAMRLAADSLGVELEVLFAERDYLVQIQLTQQIAQRAPELRPDYLIVVGEKGTLAAQLAATNEAGIYTFLAFNAVTPADRRLVGYPRQKFATWLGSLSPFAEEGGYLSAHALFSRALEQLPSGSTPELIALAGDRSSGTSIGRNQGVQQALLEFPQIRLRQQVFTDWSQAKATQQAEHLLRRYPDVRLIWAASDLLAYGAMQALAAEQPPRDNVFIGAINATDQALQSSIDGDFTALAGGHHMTGAWAIVMLYDHYHGKDFSDEKTNAEQHYSMFTLLDAPLARQLIDARNAATTINFCTFSKVCNPSRSSYDFSFASWLGSNQ